MAAGYVPLKRYAFLLHRLSWDNSGSIIICSSIVRGVTRSVLLWCQAGKQFHSPAQRPRKGMFLFLVAGMLIESKVRTSGQPQLYLSLLLGKEPLTLVAKPMPTANAARTAINRAMKLGLVHALFSPTEWNPPFDSEVPLSL